MKMFDENNNIPVCDPSKPVSLKLILLLMIIQIIKLKFIFKAFGRKLKDDEQSLEARKIFQKELKVIVCFS